MTYSALKIEHGNLIESMNLVSDSSLPSDTKNPVLGIPSFLWGCGLGVVGILVVYIVSDEDKVETKKALWGCLAWTAVVVVADVIWWGSLGGAIL